MKKFALFAMIALVAIFGFISCDNPTGGGNDNGGGSGHIHSYSGYESNSTGHWQICTDCGDATAITPHSGDPCSVCGYESTGSGDTYSHFPPGFIYTWENSISHLKIEFQIDPGFNDYLSFPEIPSFDFRGPLIDVSGNDYTIDGYNGGAYTITIELISGNLVISNCPSDLEGTYTKL